MSLPLSGPFDTAQLPRIAPEPVTVTVARTVKPGYEAQYLQWADEVIATLRTVHGCLGAGLLMPGPEGGDHQIVFRFVDGIHLREWERSPQRLALMEKSTPFVTSERITRTVGVENFFELPKHAEPKRSLWQRIVTDVLWVYPVAITMTVVATPWLAALPLLARVATSSLLITAIMRVVMGPLRTHLRSKRQM